MKDYSQVLDDINDEINTEILKNNGLLEELNVELWKSRWKRNVKIQASYNRPKRHWHDVSPKENSKSGGSFKHGPGKVVFRYKN